MNNRLAKGVAHLGITLGVFASAGCAVVERAGMAVLYKEAPLVNTTVSLDVPYTSSGHPKNRLDLFCPNDGNWPVLVFVFGGGWDSGDKALRVGGKDVYGNIGRFFAARGIGVAVVNYRLQPEVTWREQVDDVASSVAWIKHRAAEYGAATNQIFLAGHSAGGYLASFVALNSEPLARHSLSPQDVRGVVSVSGAGLDMADEETYRLGEKRSYYEKRFCDAGCPPGWDVEASPVHYVTINSPPFLILYAGGEKKALHRQSQRLAEVLKARGNEVSLVEVPGQSHQRMVLVLSRADRTAAGAILDFIKYPKNVK